MLPISNKMEKTAEETKLLNMFQGVDLSKNFYFRCIGVPSMALECEIDRPFLAAILTTSPIPSKST